MTIETELRVLQANPAPYLLPGGTTGVLLIHGYTGTPREMRRLADYLHARGLTVSAPLLPGHGQTLDAMNHHGWREWVAGAEAAYTELQERCERVVVGGLSMGSLLTIWLGAHHPELAGIALYAPALWSRRRKILLTPLLRYFVQSTAPKIKTDLEQRLSPESWGGGFAREPIPAAAELWQLQRRARQLLSQITVPALVVHSQSDQTIQARCGPETLRRLQSSDIEALRLERSGHLVTAGSEWEKVAAISYRFVERYAGGKAKRREGE
ncbi:MAG: alpha/beta fold hydrolase [Chloroflexota bacterium]|nr:alpha/beta fold hydrolase [Chloroflexota bacterium]